MDVLTVELVFVVMELPQDGLKIQLIERMAELDVVLVLAMFRMKMDQMAELVLELELSMFRMKMDRKVVLVLEMELSMFQMMDRMAELDVVLVMELASSGLVMFQMMDRMAELV